MKNGTAKGSDHINIETFTAGDHTISKTLPKLNNIMLIRNTNTHSMEER